MKKTTSKIKWIAGGIATLVALAAAITGATININLENGKVNASITYSQEQEPADLVNDQGEVVQTTEYNGEQIPTVDEVDGGMFEDADTGVSVIEGEYADLGATIETFDVSTPEAFKNATLGKCVYANNRWGAQCVSLARSYWFSYAGRDVSTCGTGAARGMMNCADQNAGDDFVVYWADSKDKIQAGDWLVFDGGQYGHIGMALGPVSNGYVALLGENQGGRACDGGGAATNIINMNVRQLIGFYRPKAYIKPEPTPPAPEPTPAPVENKCQSRKVVKGDTMGAIMKECEGKITWGAAMEEYANHWYSTKVNPGKTVFYGWTHGTGYGLFAGDVIEYRK